MPDMSTFYIYIPNTRDTQTSAIHNWFARKLTPQSQGQSGLFS